MQLAASDSLGRPLPAILEFLAKMAISARPDSRGDEEKVRIAAATNQDSTEAIPFWCRQKSGLVPQILTTSCMHIGKFTLADHYVAKRSACLNPSQK